MNGCRSGKTSSQPFTAVDRNAQPYYELILDTDTALPLIIAQFPKKMQESYAFLSPAGTVYPFSEAETKGSSDSIGKSWGQKILAQPKVLKMEEYFVYFPFLELNGWGKRFALQPQTIYCESSAFTVKFKQMPAARPLRGNRR